jgi:DNA-binding LacI/PurR family transcriptional regulator
MKLTIDHHSTIPLHVQLLQQLRYHIQSGHWAPGSRILSETELQRQLKISRSTIRQALNNAEMAGLIERVPGRGTFVARKASSGGEVQRLIAYVTVDFLSNHFQYELLTGAEQAAKAKGYRIVFCTSNNDITEENKLLDQLVKDKVAGILIWPVLPHTSDGRLFQLTQQKGVPLVLLDRTLPGLAFDCVTSNNYEGAYQATEHLIQLGHRRIVFLSRPILQLSTVSERLRGYQAAMRAAGLTPLEPWLVGIGEEMHSNYAFHAYTAGKGEDIKQIRHYLQQPFRPTAIFTMNDLIALQVLKAASQAGVRIPQDLMLVGFDNMDITAHVEVPLTTVTQDCFTLGRRAAELLIERIEGYNGLPRQEVVPTQLEIRASTSLASTQPEKKLSAA